MNHGWKGDKKYLICKVLTPEWKCVTSSPSTFFLHVLFCSEEISTLSRHASFRRMNSVSTDPRGAVLRLNYSLHIKHTAASLSYIFLPRLSDPIPACQAL